MIRLGGLVWFVMMGVWIYALLDVITTDSALVRNLSKGTWVFIVLIGSVIGAVLWFVAGRPEKAGFRPGDTSYRKPISFRAPDDDPDFLRAAGAAPTPSRPGPSASPSPPRSTPPTPGRAWTVRPRRSTISTRGRRTSPGARRSCVGARATPVRTDPRESSTGQVALRPPIWLAVSTRQPRVLTARRNGADAVPQPPTEEIRRWPRSSSSTRPLVGRSSGA